VACVDAGDAGPLDGAFRGDSSNGRIEVAAFAISTQGLSALVSRLGSARTLPEPLPGFLFGQNLRADARARRLRSTLEETVRALRDAGVEVVALKGATLAFFHYPDPALRPMGDLDLLLREPLALARATEVLVGAGWRSLFDTARHRVFARPSESVPRPASEDPDNPIRLEIHTSFRLPVLGRVYDASAELREEAEMRELGGTPVATAAGPSLVRHLLFHAAEDFAGRGIRGIQAHDFRVLARASGKLSPEISRKEQESPAPLWFAASAIERLFPDTFEERFLETLERGVSAALRARASRLPALRYTRPTRGWSRTLLGLIEEPLPRARFLLRTLLPTLGEVKANVAPGASGFALAAAWAGVLLGRVGLRRRSRLNAPPEPRRRSSRRRPP
jgi:hypothetical protein